jgi:putative transposase
MNQNELNRQHRHSIRLKDFDYAQEGAYFITICTKNKMPYFEKYPGLRDIVQAEWESLSGRFSDINLDAFIIMPNHIHGIIIKSVGATLVVARERAGTSPAPTIGNIISSFKSLCVNKWIQYNKQKNTLPVDLIWQRNYYEHIIHDDDESNLVREYIIGNPLQWNYDKYNSDGISDLGHEKKWEWLERTNV